MSDIDGYHEDLAHVHSSGFTTLAVAAARELLPRLPGRARVVDLGCGDGTTVRLLAAAGHEVLGIDASPPQIELARRRVPDASFRVGSFVDAELPAECDAIVAVGEVLGYLFDARNDGRSLDRLFARAARALRRGGMLLFDLAGPGRVPTHGRRSWHEGEGWALAVDAAVDRGELRRRIVAFRDVGDGSWRRSEEVHRLRLERPADVLRRLRKAGFSARTIPGGYGGEPLPAGLTAYLATRR